MAAGITPDQTCPEVWVAPGSVKGRAFTKRGTPLNTGFPDLGGTVRGMRLS